MKIQCDVCNKEEAAVFCTADEAVLCDGCDHRVHHANKLASKHPRFSLLHPSSKSSPLCDICQEKRVFLFCQQDRAILCRDCDISIHSANEHTQKHHRFLLTGVKVSASASVYISSFSSGGGDLVPDSHINSSHQPQLTGNSNDNSNNNITHISAPVNKSFQLPSTQMANNLVGENGNLVSGEGVNGMSNMSSGSSTISEYLMEMLPGWHVEDLLDAPSTPLPFSKAENGLFSFEKTEVESNKSSSILVPQAPTDNTFLYPQMEWQNELKASNIKEANTNFKANKRWTTDVLFAVPQISRTSSIGSKRSRKDHVIKFSTCHY